MNNRRSFIVGIKSVKLSLKEKNLFKNTNLGASFYSKEI